MKKKSLALTRPAQVEIKNNKRKKIMCGIVGIVSNKSVSASIIGALKKLEYRGYDSAGISTINKGQN